MRLPRWHWRAKAAPKNPVPHTPEHFASGALVDHRKIWRQVNAFTALKMEEPDLTAALVRLIADLFEVPSVSLWLRSRTRKSLELAASTEFATPHDLPVPKPCIKPPTTRLNLQEHFAAHELDLRVEAWLQDAIRLHPAVQGPPGPRVCASLAEQNELLGVILLGEPSAREALSADDFETLDCIAEHVASSLSHARMSERFFQTKELAAFQTMAAFFVHDLKNSASILNLTLKNLSVHFGDPAFRQDALRGVKKTVEQINRLVTRFSALRHDLTHDFIHCDLNDLIDRTLAKLETGPDLILEKRLNPSPPIPLDPDQMANVITNLVLNAHEAMNGKGVVQVATRRENNWVVLAVADQGSGMTPEFVRTSLFRPFKTTKKTGLGIGMFQSKMIVETHGGRISVLSAPGKGATFQVFLPIDGTD
jgi:putative PEP-CTERM system histidine kinase